MSFVPLHVHSRYSAMRGFSSIEDLCRSAQAQGWKTLALTDTNGLYGALPFIGTARRLGLRPILGAELVHGSGRAVALIKDAEGRANLCRLLSALHGETSFDLATAARERRAGLIFISDDEAALRLWQKDSPEDLYVELSPGAGMEKSLAFSRSSGLPPIATQRAHFTAPAEYALHRLLRAIDLNTTLSRLADGACASPLHWLAPLSVMQRYYANAPEALENTAVAAESCRIEWSFGEMLFPRFGELSDGAAFNLLREKTSSGARRRYGTVSPEVRGRVERELSVIAEKRFAHYFLIVEEIVRHAAYTSGRGSAAGSVVSYCLGITHVDPIRHGLLFERFLNRARSDPPDIDIDFPWDERDSVLKWAFDRYGGKVAMAGNHNTLGLRGAVREVAKVYGIAPEEIGRVAPLLMKEVEFARIGESRAARSWAESLFRSGRLRTPWPEILDRAVQIQGHFRHLSLHCGGLVMAPGEIREQVPVEVSARGLPVAQWDKEQIEQAGLVKIDLLGNRSLSVIRDALAAVARNSGEPLDRARWHPAGDGKTKELIQRGETLGCFNIESPATRLLLKRLWSRMPLRLREKADAFDYLVMVFSLVRPAAISYVRDFIQRAHGLDSKSLHPPLDGVLRDNHGIMLYQEDVTRVAVSLAGFTVEEADDLRRILARKSQAARLEDYRGRFYRGCRARGVPASAIDSIWRMILSFAGYSFCKPHAASYAEIAFQCAYLKAHHPAEFMAAAITHEGGFYPAHAYVSEARRMGLKVCPPDVNASEWGYQGAADSVRIGLKQLRGIDRSWIDRMLSERARSGPFRSFEDFWRRTSPQLAQVRLLIKAGALDSIAGRLSRPALLWRAHALSQYRSLAALPDPPEYSEEQKVRHEIETLGFPLTRHPLELFQRSLNRFSCVPARDLERHAGRTVTVAGFLIAEKITQTKNGDAMEFATFEDPTALFEAAFFPDATRRFYSLLGCNRPYILKGRVEDEFGAATLNVRAIEPLDGPGSKCYSLRERP